MTKRNKEKSIKRKQGEIGRERSLNYHRCTPFLEHPSMRYPGFATLLATELMGFLDSFPTSNSIDFDESLECVLSDRSISTRSFPAKQTLLFKDSTSYIYKGLLVVCRTNMQPTELGTLTYVAWIADRFGVNFWWSRLPFSAKGRSFRSLRENLLLPVVHLPLSS